ncbi:acyl-CoA reductase [Myroides pelagicus]|uniref:Acyl-CoA reductase n=1 Tax=Myroides pelagicus TaxID=270914 RepID=A0A7K1GLW3_9FLAO|nr:acyl-CoA reductase [Myroides pelagicus]MEC4113134.1 acyl-CoA reductase [Myroides pelagicus]MTH29816.1 acyl-CoA reductase [Myroides pelagicus]
MDLDVKKNAFVKLGGFLSQFTTNEFIKNNDVCHNDDFFSAFEQLIYSSVHYNGWFTEEQVISSIGSWAEALTEKNLNLWTARYDFSAEPQKRVGLILAGNIPLVGFHDFISVIISGNIAVVKLSSNDQKLLPFLAKYLIACEPMLADRIVFTEGKLDGFDAVIATGSNNTARYFDYYFSQVPNIIRKNRNSVAILNGKESHEDMIALGKDVFTYYGLGCRNVSKLFVPIGFDFDNFYKGMYEYRDVIEYEKYSNNYDYNKAVFLMSDFKILDNGFLTIKEDQGYSSPISSVFFEYYDDIEIVKTRLKTDEEKIQCIVSNQLVEGSIAFGQTQRPQLWDYADHVDTVAFLLAL